MRVIRLTISLSQVSDIPSGRRVLALLPSGTSSNEALHAEVKSWFAQTQQMHQSTLKQKLDILTLAKMLPHGAASRGLTLRQLSSRILLVRLCTPSIWTSKTWSEWCLTCKDDGSIAKASLPLEESRVEERRKVKQWNLKRPAAAKPHRRKRTVFTVERRSQLRTQGVPVKLSGKK